MRMSYRQKEEEEHQPRSGENQESRWSRGEPAFRRTFQR